MAPIRVGPEDPDEVRPERAGRALHLMFVDDIDGRIATIGSRGIDPSAPESYDNGVRKVTYRDPDGKEIGFGGSVTLGTDATPTRK